MELKFKELQIKKIDTPAFTMSPVELKEYIDFSVKRIYFVSQPRGERKTGAHCHKQEEEMFILAQGSATAVIDRGRGPEEFKWSRRNQRYWWALMSGIILKKCLKTLFCWRFLPLITTPTAPTI